MMYSNLPEDEKPFNKELFERVSEGKSDEAIELARRCLMAAKNPRSEIRGDVSGKYADVTSRAFPSPTLLRELRQITVAYYENEGD